MMADREQRRGRRSHENRIDEVIKLFRQEWIKLENCGTFAELPGVQTLERRLSHEMLKRGITLDLLIQGAVADVLGDLYAAQTPQMQRLAQFLLFWFRERRSIVEIATALQLDRTTVGRAIKRPALTLVAERFLSLAQQEDPEAASEGVQEALLRHTTSRGQAKQRASVTPLQVREM